MWPYIGEYVEGLLRTTIQPTIQGSLPSKFQNFSFGTIDLGDTVCCSHVGKLLCVEQKWPFYCCKCYCSTCGRRFNDKLRIDRWADDCDASVVVRCRCQKRFCIICFLPSVFNMWLSLHYAIAFRFYFNHFSMTSLYSCSLVISRFCCCVSDAYYLNTWLSVMCSRQALIIS